jgi:hypothetical protein
MLGWVLLAGFIVRLVGITYGLPLDLVADESSLIFGAAAMLQLKTLIPASDPAGFAHLHYPPLLPYLNLLVFVPVLVLQYLVGGFTTIAQFKEYLVDHPEVYWVPARLLQVVLGTLTVWLVYRIGTLAAGRRVGLLAATFLAFSFNHVVLSHMARQWILLVFFMTLIVYLGLAWSLRMSRMVLLGALCGLAFGGNVVGLLCWTLVAGLFAYRHRREGLRLALDRRLWASAATALAVAAGFIALHWPYFVWLFTQGMGSNVTWVLPKSWGGYGAALVFTAKVLLNQEAMPVVFGILGAVALVGRRAYAPVIGALAWAAAYLTFLYTSAHMASRFLVPFLPPLCLLAGFGLDWVVGRLPPARPGLARALVGCVVLVSLVPVARADWLLTRPDTRQLAKAWLETDATHALLVMSSGTSGVQVRRNRTALALQATYGRVGLGEAARLEKFQQRPELDRGLLAVNVQDWHPAHQNVETVGALLAQHQRAGRPAYFVVTYTSPDRLSELDRALIRQGTLVRRFDNGYGPVAIGHNFSEPVTVLFRLARLGTMVDVYRLDGDGRTFASGTERQ